MTRSRSDFGSIFRRRKSDGRPLAANSKEPCRPGYYVRVQIGGRQLWRKAGTTRKEAVEFVAKVRRDVFEETVLGVRPVVEITFRTFAKDYLEHVETTHAETTFKNETNKIDNILVPEFGAQLVSTIAKEDIERFLTKRAEKGASGATRNRYAAVLSAMFRRAIALGHARVNPVSGVKRHREPLKDVPYLTYEEQDRLVASCDETLRPFVLTALDTGARRGELLALTWADVDLGRNVISIRRSKNGEPREVQLSVRCRASMEVMKAVRVRPLHGPDRVFVSIPECWPACWNAAYHAAVATAKLPHLRIHDLRHVCAVNLVRANVPLPDVGKWLGHKTLTMVLRYARHCPADAGARALAAVERHRAATASEASKAVTG